MPNKNSKSLHTLHFTEKDYVHNGGLDPYHQIPKKGDIIYFDNLMKLKLASIRVYKSDAWVAIFTILYGEELIRDAYILV